MTSPTIANTPEIEVIGGVVPSDELLELLADWLLDLVEDEDGDQ